jgi:hypothetical protein
MDDNEAEADNRVKPRARNEIHNEEGITFTRR